MKKNIFNIFTIILFASVISGCGLLMIGIENTSNSIFKSPKKVHSKVDTLIYPDVTLSAYWIGHSSTLLQIHDKIILIDPVFNDVISAVMLRRQTAALEINKLPKLDIILESHAHMDHLSISTLSDLEDEFPKAKLVFPEGTEEFLPGYDFEFIKMKTGNTRKKVIGETKVIDGVKITTVYALHFGGRFGLDSYLWNMPGCTAYIIEYKGVTVFYAGDTLYDEEAYKSLGKKFNIDLAIIPIGPCSNCEEVYNYNHVASYGALLMFDDLKAKWMLPVHYGALTYRRDPDYPMFVLKEIIDKKVSSSSMQSNESYKDRVKILDEGEQYIFLK